MYLPRLRPLVLLLSACLTASVCCQADPGTGTPEPASNTHAAPVADTHTEAEHGSISPQGMLQEGRAVVRWASDRTSDLLTTSLSLLGVRYRRGASDPQLGFDCSGFVRHVYLQAVGLLLPHNAYSMSLQGHSVTQGELKPGDLVFFNTLRHQFSHVGIYLGDRRFIHAPSAGKTVQVDTLDDSYWRRHFNGARRLDALLPGATASEPHPDQAPGLP